MKKVLMILIPVIIIIGVITTFVLVNRNNNLAGNDNKTTINDENNEGDDIMSLSRIKLTINNEEIFVSLNDSEASKDFQAMLPLTLTFEDYNNTEKIATLPSELNTTGSPSGYDPKIGDFSYYIPWGNLSLFYKDFRYSNSLVKLGTIESGIDIIENLSGNFTAQIEKVN